MKDYTKNQAAYDSSPLGVLLFKEVTEDGKAVDLRIVYANEAACRILTGENEGVVGKTLGELGISDQEMLLDTHREILVNRAKRSVYEYLSGIKRNYRFDCFSFDETTSGCFMRDAEFEAEQAFNPDEAVDTRPMTEMEKGFSEVTKKHIVYDNEFYGLENENDFVCFSDIESREILKIITSDAGAARRLLDEDIRGKICYKVLQNRDDPCPFCSNRLLQKDRYHIWQNRNDVVNKDYLHRTRMVKLDGTYVRMDVAQDITDDRRKALLMAETMEGMSLWTECMSLLLGETDLQDAIEAILKNIAAFYGASSGIIVLFGQKRYETSWAEEGSYPVPPLFRDPTQAALQEWGSLLKGQAHVMISDTADAAIPASIKEFFANSGIESTQLSPIYVSGKLRGIMCLSNVSRNKTQIYMVDMVAQSIAHTFQQTELQENLSRLRFRDTLTGYLNFDGFRLVAENILKENETEKYSLWYSDIRRFKYINDMFGYEVGDSFLRYWADITRDHMRGGETFCRISADNVAVLRRYDDIEDLRNGFNKIVSLLQDFPELKERNFKPELISGVYLLDEEDAQNPDINKMLNRANIAQKSTKGKVGSSIDFYDASMRDKQLRELTISQHLEKGLKNGEFYIALQPQYNYATDEVVGAEALVRWMHPGLGNISPGEFIPLLERAGLISQLDQFVWEEACKFLRSMLDDEAIREVVPLSVNISRVDIYLPDLGGLLSALVEKYNLSSSLLKLEITESAYIADSKQLIGVVEDLRRRGFSVEMDDFGSGYSSLNTLKDVPVDALKLDMRFLIMDEGNGKRGGNILSSVIRMAHWMGLPVIAEGVETKEQADYLENLGCYMMQGYYFARPMPKEDLAELMVGFQVGEMSLRDSGGDILGAGEFLDAEGATSYLFNNCIGGGCLLEYDGQDFEALLLNDAFFKTLGVSRETIDIYRTNMIDLFVDEDKPILIEGFNRAIDEGSCAVEVRIVRENDEPERWVRGTHHYLASREGKYMIFALVDDITEQRLSRMRLSDVEGQLESIIDLMPGGLFRYRAEGDDSFDYISDGLLNMLGLSFFEFGQRFKNRFSLMVYASDRDFVLDEIEREFKLGKDSLHLDYRVETAYNEVKIINDKRRLVCDSDGNKWWYVIVTDMGRFGKINSDHRWQIVQQYVSAEQHKMVLLDYNAPIDEMVLSIEDNDGTPHETVVEHYYSDKKFERIHPDDQERYYAVLTRALQEQLSGSMEFRGRYNRPEYGWCRLSYVSISNNEGEIERFVGRIDDIEAEKQLQQQINRDALTGLLNQSATKSAVSAALDERQLGALFVIDVDDFKEINDTLGHLFGDSFLREVSQKLQKVFRDGDILGRIGGDEFLAFVSGALEIDVIKKKAESILTAFEDIKIPQIGSVHASVGIAIVDEEFYHDYPTLFKKADRALYKAKQKGKNCYVVFHAKDGIDNTPLPITTRVTQEAEIEHKATWPATLAGDVFTILYHAEKTPDGINEAIAHVGRWLDVSRVYVIEKHDGLLFNTFEWCNTGINSEIDNLQSIPDGDENGEGLYIENFDMDSIFYLRQTEDAPAWQRAILEPQNIKSMLQYGIIEKNEFLGSVGFDECRENVFWTKEQVEVLVRIAQMIAVFLRELRFTEKLS